MCCSNKFWNVHSTQREMTISCIGICIIWSVHGPCVIQFTYMLYVLAPGHVAHTHCTRIIYHVSVVGTNERIIFNFSRIENQELSTFYKELNLETSTLNVNECTQNLLTATKDYEST